MQNVTKGGYIPENIFYRLAMKANNQTAKAFQARIADDIMPTLRKTGSYSVAAKNLNPALADKLLEIAKLMEPSPERQRVLLHVANLLVGQDTF